MSEIVRPTRDGVYGREFISTLVDVGSKRKSLQFNQEDEHFSKTTEVSLPIIFDYLPPNLNSHSILESVAGASLRTGTIYIATPAQANQLQAGERDQFAPLISSDEVGEAAGWLRDARLIELAGYDSSTVEEVRERQLHRSNLSSLTVDNWLCQNGSRFGSKRNRHHTSRSQLPRTIMGQR